MSGLFLVFLQGGLIGLTVAAPIGPINVLCIQRTLTRGAASGFATAFGCAAADASYGAIAAFGLSVISGFLMDEQMLFRLVGALVLTALAIKSLIRGPAGAGNSRTAGALLKDLATSYAFTLSNPLTIVIFAALFAGLDPEIISKNSGFGPVLLTSGVFAGTFIWMTLMIILSLALRRRAGDRFLLWANRLGVGLLLGFAAFLAWSALAA